MFMSNTYTAWKNDQAVIFKGVPISRSLTSLNDAQLNSPPSLYVCTQVYDEQTRFMLSQTAKPKADAAIQAEGPDTHEASFLFPAFPPTGSCSLGEMLSHLPASPAHVWRPVTTCSDCGASDPRAGQHTQVEHSPIRRSADHAWCQPILHFAHLGQKEKEYVTRSTFLLLVSFCT
jgi:hypothetical protein